MRYFGLDFQHHGPLVIYLLTLLAATLPVAGAAGLIYRMGRLFGLRRSLRTGLAICVVLGSGLISYAVVLNSHAPAAALVLSACRLIHLVGTRKPARPGIWANVDFSFWFFLCGLCAALAAVIDLGAGFFLIGLILVILAVRWPTKRKLAALGLYALGMLGPLLLHALLTLSMTHELRRPSFTHNGTQPIRPPAPSTIRRRKRLPRTKPASRRGCRRRGPFLSGLAKPF